MSINGHTGLLTKCSSFLRVKGVCSWSTESASTFNVASIVSKAGRRHSPGLPDIAGELCFSASTNSASIDSDQVTWAARITSWAWNFSVHFRYSVESKGNKYFVKLEYESRYIIRKKEEYNNYLPT